MQQAGFLDGKEYGDDFLCHILHSVVGNGVYDGELSVTADGSSMYVILSAGRAWLNGMHYYNDAPLKIPINQADGVYKRIDTIVIRRDNSLKNGFVAAVEGSIAQNPKPPDIERTPDKYEIKLCNIHIPPGTIKITQNLIEDTRLDNKVCGLTHFPIEHINTSTLYLQIQNELAQFKQGADILYAEAEARIKQILAFQYEQKEYRDEAELFSLMAKKYAEKANASMVSGIEQVSALYWYLQYLIQEQQQHPLIVRDPTTGVYGDVQIALDNLYLKSCCEDGLTVEEFAELGLTVEEFAAYNLTVEDFAEKGKILLGKELKNG